MPVGLFRDGKKRKRRAAARARGADGMRSLDERRTPVYGNAYGSTTTPASPAESETLSTAPDRNDRY